MQFSFICFLLLLAYQYALASAFESKSMSIFLELHEERSLTKSLQKFGIDLEVKGVRNAYLHSSLLVEYLAGNNSPYQFQVEPEAIGDYISTCTLTFRRQDEIVIFWINCLPPLGLVCMLYYKTKDMDIPIRVPFDCCW
jgi:hypothetical protein